MGETETATVAVPTPGLFELFREFKNFKITDPSGLSMEFGLRSLDYLENQELVSLMDSSRKDIDVEFDKYGATTLVAEQVAPLTVEQTIDQLIVLERSTAKDNVDLAPGTGPEETADARAEREKVAMTKWEELRRSELLATGAPILRQMLVERRLTIMKRSKMYQKFMDGALCRMVVHPSTREPLLSENPKAKNYIGKLQGRTRELLVEHRQKFVDTVATDQAQRKAAESGAFLPPGELPSVDNGIPGETTETPSDSPIGSYPSTG